MRLFAEEEVEEAIHKIGEPDQRLADFLRFYNKYWGQASFSLTPTFIIEPLLNRYSRSCDCPVVIITPDSRVNNDHGIVRGAGSYRKGVCSGMR